MISISKPGKCCFCVPLREGLLCIGYLRLILCLLSIIHFMFMCVSMFKRMEDSYDDAVTFVQSVASILSLVLDLSFTLLFIIAAHMKNEKLLRVYYVYSVVLMLIYILVVVLTSCDVRRFKMLYYMTFQFTWFIDWPYVYIVFGVVTIVLQAYMTLLVKSELCYLKACSNAEHEIQTLDKVEREPKIHDTNN